MKGANLASFVGQLPALAGVLIGAAATYMATSASDRARWRREHSIRWDEKKADAYAEYGNALKKVISVAVRIAVARGVHDLGEPLLPEEGMAVLAAAEQDRQSMWEAVLLLGSDNVVKAARDWQRSIFMLAEIARGVHGADNWDASIGAASTARGKFYKAARSDLGLPTEDVENFEWQFSRAAAAPRLGPAAANSTELEHSPVGGADLGL
jgi:hypothetical protein